MDASIQQRAALIRLLILDVDGILTDGRLFYSAETQPILQAFHVRDGLGMRLLQKAGIPIAIISGKNLPSTLNRLKDLQIEHYYLGHSQKMPAYETLKQTLQLPDEAIAYMGDDLPDLPVMQRVGLAITVPKTPALLQEHAHYITHAKAGKGAVREVCELILQAKNLYQSVIDSYLAT